MKKEKISFLKRFLIILLFHLFAYIACESYFFFDVLSIPYQTTSSLIQIIFIFLTIKLLINPVEKSTTSSYIGIALIIFFIILNIHSIDLEVRFHDNSYVSWWSLAAQKIYGYPCVFLRIYQGSLQNLDYKIGNYLIHYNHFFLNIYIITLILAIQNKYLNKIIEKTKAFIYS